MSHQIQHQPSQRQLVALMIAAALFLLTYVALLATFSRSGFPTSMVSSSRWPALMDKPVGEDGYYMLTVADNIATKGHILYNQGMPATGIQPLSTMIFAALDWMVRLFGGGTAAIIRSVMVLGVALFTVLAWQISRIAASMAPAALRATAATLAFLMTLFSYTLFRLFTYGLETGIYLIAVAVCFQITLKIAERKHAGWREMVLLGIGAGIAAEARIDFGLLFAILLCSLLWYRWASLIKVVSAGSIALLLVSPWFLFVHRVSGSWLPSSGKAESAMIAHSSLAQRLSVMMVAVAGELMPWCYAVFSHLTVLVALLSTVLLVVFLAYRAQTRHMLGRLLLSRHSRIWLACFLCLIAVYFVLFSATHFYYRYVAPLCILMLPACAVALAHARWVRRHMYAVAAILCVSFAAWTFGALHTGKLGNSQTIAAGYVHTYFPDAHVGAFQSGVVGFFNRNVENLDGKLNQGALKATAAHQLPAFIDRERIQVIVDWPSVIQAALPADYLRNNWAPCPVPITGDTESVCLMRKASSLQEAGRPRL